MITFEELRKKLSSKNKKVFDGDNKNVRLKTLNIKNSMGKSEPIQTPGTSTSDSVTGLSLIWPDTFRGK